MFMLLVFLIILLELVFFLSRCLVRFPSHSAVGESLGGPLTLPRMLLCVVEPLGC